MKNLTIVVLFLVLSASWAMKLKHVQELPSSPSSSNGTSTNSTSNNQSKPNPTSPSTPTNPSSPSTPSTPSSPSGTNSSSSNTTSPEKPNNNASGSQNPTPVPAPSSGGQTTPAASDDLTADQKKQYDAWQKNLIPWAKYENGQDNSAFFNSEVEKKYGLAKKNEIKSRRHK